MMLRGAIGSPLESLIEDKRIPAVRRWMKQPGNRSIGYHWVRRVQVGVSQVEGVVDRPIAQGITAGANKG
ncbi:hypothetical protein E2C01_068422 [Portunus trituberculatus]|uniref:Uncharacterized protein n=1 Tax=Portunus trituberculatus TaxID=210409 RepID=A0A5B7HXU1_PORTR|nr:hypothetical protein [Portunus trituberculatus]